MSQLLKAPLRALIQDKSYTFINIAGLVLGIACFIVLALYLQHDLTYDKHHSKSERIYRVVFEWSYSAGATFSATSSSALGPLLRRSYPEVEDQVHFRKIRDNRALLRVGDYANYEEGIYIADNSALKIFDHGILFGDPNSAITEPYTLAISESVAMRYFGPGNPVGQTVIVDDNSYRVDLVFADLPDNSHLKYQILLANIGDMWPITNSMWSVGDGFTYVLLHNEFEKLGPHYVYPTFFEDHMASYTRAGGYHAKLFLEPLTDIHLRSNASADLPRGNLAYLYAFGAVALFVLLVACINYINLATARAVKRNKEISLRKILGASRRGIIASYLLESMFYAFLALLLATGLVEFVLNFTPIGSILGKKLELNLWSEPATLVALLGLGGAVGLLAGLYPAFYLSAMATHREAARGATNKNSLRECLVLLQFTVSISVIAATFLMLAQMQYINSKPLGFDKNNRLIVEVYGAEAINKLPTLMNQIEQHPNVHKISRLFSSPWQGSLGGAIEIPLDDALHSMEVYYARVDESFLETMDINLLAGRNLESARDSFDQERNSISVLVNQTLINASTWADPIGQFFKIGSRRFNVVGVVQDFHFDDFHQPITPYFLVLDQFDVDTMDEQTRKRARKELVISIANDNIPDTLAFLQKSLSQLNPHRPVELKFLDDTLNGLYVNDQRQMQLIGVFSVICVAISCLGLFGLTAFNTQRRTKEIGIRKTLGATATGIITMLFLKVGLLVLLGGVVAAFIAYFGIQFWLDSFYYRNEINFLVFPLSIVLALFIAFVTVTLQAGKTVLANPARSLRYE